MSATTVALLMLAFVVAVLAGANRLLPATTPHPVPLLPTSTAAGPLSGWLLEAGPAGEVEAFNLATGARRVLIASQPNFLPEALVSPDHRLLAETVSTARSPGPPRLRIYRIDGTLLHNWDARVAEGNSLVLGWLNAGELLLRQDVAPLTGSASGHDRPGTATQGQLIAFNVRNGARQVLLLGDYVAAAASPDGQAVALDRLTPGSSTKTLELRPVQGGRLGPPTATVARGVYPVVWTPDSQRVVFTVAPATPMTGRYDIDALSRSGQLTTIARLPSSLPANLGGSVPVNYNVAGVTPDGTQVVYGNGGSYWEVPLTGGPPRQLDSSTAGAPGYGATVVWSPEQTIMAVTIAEPSFLTTSGERQSDDPDDDTDDPSPQAASTQTSAVSYVTLAFAPSGRPLGALLDQFTYPQLLAWLPENALPARPATPAVPSGTFGGAQATPDLGSPQPELTADSRLSPDGTQALVVDRSYDFALAVPLDAGPPVPVIAGAPDDASWLPDGSGAIGVQPQTVGGATTSRIAVYAPAPVQINGSVVQVPAAFDPAGLGASTTARYARPLVAPDGLRYSFIVVDGRAVALWFGGRNAPPTVVAHWTLPANARVTPPLVASWVSNDALVFSEPGGWVDGLPQRVSLERLTVLPDGTTTIAPLVGWHAQGGEQGITLQALRRSPDGTRLAVRLRHYTGTNPATERFDAIVVLPARDLTQGVELARGGAGAGLSWSPDGGELAAALDGGLEVLAADGSQVARVPTGKGAVSDPLWVGANTIWYEAGSGVSAQVRQVVR